MPATSNVFQKLGATVSITSSTSSGSAAISCPTGTNCILVTNVDGTAANYAYVEFGSAAPTVTSATGTPIRANSTLAIAAGPNTTFVGVIAAAATPIIKFTPGRMV